MKIYNEKFFTIILTIILCVSCSWGTGTSEPPGKESLSLPQAITDTGTTYYVSPTGDDSKNGLSDSQAWKSISKVNTSNLLPGDSVLFKSGGVYRGTLFPESGNSQNWIKYGSYGTGEKPILNGSLQLNTALDWEPAGVNIWRSTAVSSYDVGALYNGAEGQIGNKKWAQGELQSANDFFYNTVDDKLYLYAAASPETIHTSLEAAFTRHVIDQSNSQYILFEGLHLTKGSAHGFGGGNTDHLIIKNCDFSYLGGGFLFIDGNGNPVRYGNGVEFWGNASNNLVLNCRFWEIYDTALTNQNHSSVAVQKNLFYVNNMIYNCALASFEIWNRPSGSRISHVYFLHNSSINPGQGWGAVDRPKNDSFHVASFYNEALTDNIVIMNNIFYSSTQPASADNSTWYHLFFYDENVNGNFANYLIDHNLWEMPSPLWAVKPDPSEAPDLYNSLSAWQGIHNQSLNGLTGEPLFPDITQLNIVPSPGSPAINGGTPDFLEFRMNDFGGNAISGLPDLGVWEIISVP